MTTASSRAPTWVNWAATFAVTAFVFWWVLNSTPLYGVFATLSLVVLVIVDRADRSSSSTASGCARASRWSASSSAIISSFPTA